MTVILAAVAWLLTYLAHSTVLLAGALALAGLGLVQSHAARDTLWKVALVGGLVTATAQAALRLEPTAGHVAIASYPESPFIDIAGVRAIAPVASRPDVESPAGADFASAISAQAAPESSPTREVRPLFSRLHISWPAMLLNLWFIGALGLGVRLLWTRLALARALRVRRPLTDGPLSGILFELAASAALRAPRLSVSDTLSSPIAFGGEIILPARVGTDLSPAEQRAVLAHELGHVARRDPAWLMLALAIESLFFIQPLNRLARRRLRAASEYLCDDWAAERAGGIVLARCLAEVAGWVQVRPAPAVVAGMAGHCSHLVSRVERLLEGQTQSRPTRWLVRAAAGALALGLVAWSVPGVAAEDLNARTEAFTDDGSASPSPSPSAGASVRNARWDGDGWAQIRDDGHLLILAPGYTVRLSGSGRLGFRQWGRAIVVPDDYEIQVGGQAISTDRDVAMDESVRIVSNNDNGAWQVTPVRRRDAPAFAERPVRDRNGLSEGDLDRSAAALGRAAGTLARNVNEWTQTGLRASLSELRRSTADLEAEAATDAALDGDADAAIDTLIQLWMRDPEAVRRAARRIARSYDHDLRPQFESLGVEVGRQLAPQLQRLTDRVGRDLAPEFARFGAELGLSIVSALGEDPSSGAGASDFRSKKGKNR